MGAGVHQEAMVMGGKVWWEGGGGVMNTNGANDSEGHQTDAEEGADVDLDAGKMQ